MIVITAPTGQIGRQLLNNLLDSGEALRVIARDPARLPEAVRRRVEVVAGSHGDPAVVDRALDGADALFWLYPSDPRAPDARAAALDFTKAAAAAVERHAVSHVVSISALGRGVTDRAGLVSIAWELNDLLAASGASFRELTLPGFMDNVLRQVGSIAEQGAFFEPSDPDLLRPMCATRDIAAAAASLLLDRGWTGRATRAVLGPREVSLRQMAQIASEVLDRPVRVETVPVEAYRARLLGAGFTESMAEAMVEMVVAKDAGLDDAEPRTPESTSPTTFRTWCAEVLAPAMPPG